MKCDTSSRCFLVSSWILSILGLALIIVAFTVPPIIDKKLADGIKDATTLTVQSRNENSLSYRTFVDSLDPDAVPTYMKHFLYNLTNPEDFLNGDKPKFVELGPWVYRKVTKRVNVEFNRDTMGDYTVSFNPVQYYLFDAEQTAPGLSHETPITTLNVVFQILRHKGLGALAFNATDAQRMYMTRPAGEIILGFDFDILGKTLRFPGFMPNKTGDQPSTTRDTWYTGEDTPMNIGRIHTSKGSRLISVLDPVEGTRVNAWPEYEANVIRGTDGTRFAPGRTKDAIVHTLVTDVNRVVPMDYKGEMTIHGVKLYNYGLTSRSMENSTINPENAKYDMFGPYGTLNMTRFNNMPMLYTKPHFLDVPGVFEEVMGLSMPDRRDHDITLGVEPLTGMTMYARKGIQVNIYTQGPLQVGEETWFPKMNNILFPVGWILETGTIPSGKADSFRSSVYTARDASKVLHYVGFIAGVVFVFLASILLCLYKRVDPNAMGELDATINTSYRKF